ncbi:MAG: dihydroorotate dehydrogenase electron transfer subunit [Pseudomonadota bacterium]
MVKAAGEKSDDPLLRRPFSIHRVAGDTLTLIFKIVGRGTHNLSRMASGDVAELIGPLGNGFKIQEKAEFHYLVGGGMGVAPLLFLAETIRARMPDAHVVALVGARTASELDNFRGLYDVPDIEIKVATDDGSAGHHGFVTELLEHEIKGKKGIHVYCCGPQMMMEKVARQCRVHGVNCQVSLEAHMACGIGACLGCAVSCAGEEKKYLHVCKDGPVFEAGRVWP